MRKRQRYCVIEMAGHVRIRPLKALKRTEPEFVAVLIAKGFVVRKSPHDAMGSSL